MGKQKLESEEAKSLLWGGIYTIIISILHLIFNIPEVLYLIIGIFLIFGANMVEKGEKEHKFISNVLKRKK